MAMIDNKITIKTGIVFCKYQILICVRSELYQIDNFELKYSLNKQNTL